MGERAEDGSQQVQHFEPGDEVLAAADFETIQGLVRNNWLVPLDSYADFEAAESKDAFGLALAEAMEEATTT